MDNDSHNQHPPLYRMTVTLGRIHLEPWCEALAPVAPGAPALRDAASRGVFLADMYHVTVEDCERREIAVSPLDPEAPIPAFVSEALVTWATAVGKHRVWLPDGILEIEPEGVPAGAARVTCATCGSNWSNHDEEFFAMVRKFGCFPPACWMCGRSIGQWTVDGIQPRLFGSEAAA